MKILLHIPWGIKKDFIGGTERFVINLAKGLNQEGHEAFIVCSNLEKEIIIEGVLVRGFIPIEFRMSVKKYGYVNENFIKNEILGKKISKKSLKLFSKYVSDQISNFDYDVLHLNGFFYSLYLDDTIAIPARTIITNHETKKELTNYWGNGAYKVFEECLCDSSFLLGTSTLIVPSRYYAREFSDIFNKEVISIPLGIIKIQSNKDCKRRKRKTPVILMPSRFEIHQKGHDIALKALAILKSEGLDFFAIFSGFDRNAYAKNCDYFHSLAKAGNILEYIELKRFDKMIDAYRKADIVISPERFCSYGLAISESLSLGIPTILSPIPTYKEIAKDYAHAYFMKQNTAMELAEEIKRLLIGEYGRNYAEAERFSKNNDFERCVHAYISLYKSKLL